MASKVVAVDKGYMVRDPLMVEEVDSSSKLAQSDMGLGVEAVRLHDKLEPLEFAYP
jgi:hypothetical protein